MSVTFEQKTWQNGETGGTPITAEELNRVEQGIEDVVTQSNTDNTTLDGHIAESVNSEGGSHDLRYYNGVLSYKDANDTWQEIETGGNDYEDLLNLPSINGIELLGNKTVGLLSGNIQIGSNAISYDNTASGLSATDVKSALDELANGGGGGGTSNYPNLTNKPSINGVELLGNKVIGLLSTNIQVGSDRIGYSGTVSGANTAKEAIELLKSSIDNISVDADNVSYDNTASGMSATNVQNAIDEVDSKVDEVIEGANTLQKIFYYTDALAVWMNDGNHNGFIGVNGAFNANSDWRCTDYIPVKNGDYVFGSINNFGGRLPSYALYDSNKEFISSYKPYGDGYSDIIGWYSNISSTNAAYIRVNFMCVAWQGINTTFLGIIRNRDDKRIQLTLDSSKPRTFYNSTNVFEAFTKAYVLGNCDLYICDGTYDIIADTEFTDDGTQRNVIEVMSDRDASNAWGLKVGRNNKYYGNGGKITLINTEAANSRYYYVDYFVSLVSAIHIQGTCELNNLFVVVENCRYAVHEDAPAYMDSEELANEAEGYIVKYNQCIMYHKCNIFPLATYTSNCVIGAGTYTNSKSYISGGYYEISDSNKPAISYHNNSDSNSSEYVMLENVQLGANGNYFQFYGFVASGSIINAFLNGCWSPTSVKIVGTANRISLNQADFAKNVTASTTDITAGTTPLETGNLYVVYE